MQAAAKLIHMHGAIFGTRRPRGKPVPRFKPEPKLPELLIRKDYPGPAGYVLVLLGEVIFGPATRQQCESEIARLDT